MRRWRLLDRIRRGEVQNVAFGEFIALVEALSCVRWQERAMPAGLRSFGQLPRARYTSLETSIFIGQTYSQRLHRVQHQIQGVVDSSSSIPSMAMRMNLRGSMFSRPDAGHPDEHSPQVRQASKLAPAGSNSSAACLKWRVGIAVCAMARS